MKWKRDRITYASQLITDHILEMSVGERLLIISERDHSHHGRKLRSIAYSRLIIARIKKKFENITHIEYTALPPSRGFVINEPAAIVWHTVFGKDFDANLPNNTHELLKEGHLTSRGQSTLYRSASNNDRLFDIVLHIGNTNLGTSLFKALFTGVQSGRMASISNISSFAAIRLYHLTMLDRKTQYFASNIIDAAQTTITCPKGTNIVMTPYKSFPAKPNTTVAHSPSSSTHLPGIYLTLTPSNTNIDGTIEATLLNHEDVLLTLTIANNMLQKITIRKNKKFTKHPTFKVFDQDPFLNDTISMKHLKKPVFSSLSIKETDPYANAANTKGATNLLYKANKYDKININSDLTLCIIFKQELRTYAFQSRSISVVISKSDKSPFNIILNTVE